VFLYSLPISPQLYGDHLYSKNEFDLAIVQYSHTIGYIPPSYVVMKFLDPYRIANLISYLEKLCDKGLATKVIRLICVSLL
jgi:hypothetical protein